MASPQSHHIDGDKPEMIAASAPFAVLSAAMLAVLPSPARADNDGAERAAAITATSDNRERIGRIVADLPRQIVTQDSRAQSLSEAMRSAQVPSVSVAVFVDGKLAWAQAWGYADPLSRRRATTETLYQAASISKPVTALAAMKLVERGALELDADISDAIDGWHVSTPITLRQLLSHTAGLSVSGFGGYPAGTALPTPLQILKGEPPANSQPVVSKTGPGEGFSYSGGGYIAVQLLVAQASGKPFADALHEIVLAPLGMVHSTFAQPLLTEAQKNAAKASAKGEIIPGGGNTYPELAAAGLWSTPSDLGRLAVDVQNAQRDLQSTVATPSTARAMLTQQIGGYGIGFDLNTLNGERVFEHAGLNRAFEARLVASAEEAGPRYVIVVMTNGEGGTAIADGLIRSIAREYRWPAFAPRTVRKVAVKRSDLARYVGLYRSGKRSVGIELFKGELYVRDNDWRRGLMIPTGDGEFVVENRTGSYRFALSESGEPNTLTIDRPAEPQSFERIPDVAQSQKLITILLNGTPAGTQINAPLIPRSGAVRQATIQLAPGRYALMIGDAQLDTVNLGASLGRSDVPLGRKIDLASNGDDLLLTIVRPGSYRFQLGAAERGRPQLEVTLLQSTRNE